MWVLRQICAPARYLRIVQGGGWLSSKATYDFVLPIFAAGLATLLILWFKLSLGFFAIGGSGDKLLSLLNILLPFFIGALAAVATFHRKGLDRPLKGDPAVIKLLHKDGRKKDVVLTNRQFLCYLFGFLTFSSLLAFFAILISSTIGPEFFQPQSLDTNLRFAIRGTLIFLFFFWLFQLLFAMLLGLYFLTDRLQFLDRKDL